MRFSWTSDPWGYTLRDGDGNAQALLTRNNEGWWANLLQPQFPGSGPYKSQVKAGEFVVGMIRRKGWISDTCEVGPVPYVRGKPTGFKPKALPQK